VVEYYFRFSLGQRLLHGLLVLSFLGLVATGMPLRYNQAGWAIWLSHTLGGFGVMGFFHRTFAVFLTLCFLLHLGEILSRLLCLGPRPSFGRFTYWEKFDYWAVFWGMAIIGTTGFMLWFPAFFSAFFPGWIFNVALVIHGEEALLAAGFIFAIHFFNSHLRPEKFPMDAVIFTGRLSQQELQEERPAEYAKLVESGNLATLKTDPPPRWMKNFSWVLGGASVGVGLLLFILILFAVFLGEGK
jgi:cytochrome b subunit of formate dehydrogenase